MINILLSSFVGSIIIIGNAYSFNYLVLKKKDEFDIYNDTFFGFILIGFISLLINFFFPINKYISTIFLFFSILIFIYFFIRYKKKKNLIWSIAYLTIITFLIITFANINRPDAGLYHLPFIKILNENKIIIGLTNLHYRFGHTSLFQYISAIHVNFIFKEEFLNIPLAILPGVYFLFLYGNLKSAIKKSDKKNVVAIFLLSAFSFYSFNRFSGLGNDGPASIFFFILLVHYLKIQKIESSSNSEFNRILIITAFLLMLKPFMVLTLLIPIFLFIINKDKIKLIIDLKKIFCLVFITLWFLKNIISSSCIIFPLKQTCFSKLIYSNDKVVFTASNEAEAWAKGYPDSKIKNGFEQYNSNFNWLNTWVDNHFKKVVEKILPLILLIVILVLTSLTSKNKYSSIEYRKNFLNKKLLYLVCFLTFCLIVWFLKFPVYRFGLPFIASFIIIIYVHILVTEDKKFYNEKIISAFLIFGFIILCAKNISRIVNKFDQNYFNAPWPAIYSLNNKDNNNLKKFEKIFDKKNKFLFFYSNGVECMYSKSPCSNYLNKDIKKITKFGYKVFYF